MSSSIRTKYLFNLRPSGVYLSLPCQLIPVCQIFCAVAEYTNFDVRLSVSVVWVGQRPKVLYHYLATKLIGGRRSSLNFLREERRRKDENIATSGQPTQAQFHEIAAAGYKAIINLALPSSTNAIADEGAIATDLGMAYFHLPVVWEAPQLEDLQLFFGLMDTLQPRQV